MSQRWFIGLSSGSGLSGVEAALVRVQGIGLDMTLHVEQFLHQPYSREIRDLLRGAAAGTAMPVRTVALLHRALGDSFAGAVRQLIDDAKFDSRRVTCIGSSGHTIWHETDGRLPTTLNVGLAGVIAERTGLTTLTDPRSQDVVAGGQGGPLTALADWLLSRDPAGLRVLLHVGEMVAVVALSAGCHTQERIGVEAEAG